jgi:hypothetical protein
MCPSREADTGRRNRHHSQMGQDSDPCDDWFSRYSQLTRDEAESLAKAEGRMFRTVWPGSLWTDDERGDRLTIVLDQHGGLDRMFPG